MGGSGGVPAHRLAVAARGSELPRSPSRRSFVGHTNFVSIGKKAGPPLPSLYLHFLLLFILSCHPHEPFGGMAARCPAAASWATVPPPLPQTAQASRSSVFRSAGGAAAAVFDPAKTALREVLRGGAGGVYVQQQRRLRAMRAAQRVSTGWSQSLHIKKGS